MAAGPQLATCGVPDQADRRMKGRPAGKGSPVSIIDHALVLRSSASQILDLYFSDSNIQDICSLLYGIARTRQLLPCEHDSSGTGHMSQPLAASRFESGKRCLLCLAWK